jgi:hypothetical protein
LLNCTSNGGAYNNAKHLPGSVDATSSCSIAF